MMSWPSLQLVAVRHSLGVQIPHRAFPGHGFLPPCREPQHTDCATHVGRPRTTAIRMLTAHEPSDELISNCAPGGTGGEQDQAKYMLARLATLLIIPCPNTVDQNRTDRGLHPSEQPEPAGLVPTERVRFDS
jgi:hypothetical protein